MDALRAVRDSAPLSFTQLTYQLHRADFEQYPRPDLFNELFLP